MNIQAVNAYTSQLGATGGATQGAPSTESAQQHGVSRDTLDQLDDKSLARDHEPDADNDQSSTDEPPLAGYTANAQRTVGGSGASGTISILA